MLRTLAPASLVFVLSTTAFAEPSRPQYVDDFVRDAVAAVQNGVNYIEDGWN